MPEVFGLYLILTHPRAGYEACAEAAVEAGVRFLQLRMKGKDPGALLRTASRIREITQGTDTLFVVNDDVQVAREVEADGVHLGQEDMPLQQARRLWPEPGKLFGLSTHSAAQERAARDLAPDYIGVGPVFPTTTKERPDPVLGADRAAGIIAASPLTTVAIGGINAQSLPDLLARGVTNFAVVSAVCDADDPAGAIEELMDLWRTRGRPAAEN